MMPPIPIYTYIIFHHTVEQINFFFFLFCDFNTMGKKMYAWTVDCLWVCWRCLNWIYRIWSTYIFIISFLNIYMQIEKDATHFLMKHLFLFFIIFYASYRNSMHEYKFSFLWSDPEMDLNLSIKLLISWTNNKSKHHFPLFLFSFLYTTFFHWKKIYILPHFNLSFLFIDKI